MKIVYEWDIETLDRPATRENDLEAEILDHSHGDKLAEPHFRPLEENQRLVLVRNLHDTHTDDLAEREWADVFDGKLPERFTDAFCETAGLVPQRFHAELRRSIYHKA